MKKRIQRTNMRIFCTIPPASYLILSLWAGEGNTLEPLTLVPIPALAAAMF